MSGDIAAALAIGAAEDKKESKKSTLAPNSAQPALSPDIMAALNAGAAVDQKEKAKDKKTTAEIKSPEKKAGEAKDAKPDPLKSFAAILEKNEPKPASTTQPEKSKQAETKKVETKADEKAKDSDDWDFDD